MRSPSFLPNVACFATARDDSTAHVWSFPEGREEHVSGSRMGRQVLRWHLTMDLLLSDSKDNLLKLSDPALEVGLQLMLYVPHILPGVI